MSMFVLPPARREKLLKMRNGRRRAEVAALISKWRKAMEEKEVAAHVKIRR